MVPDLQGQLAQELLVLLGQYAVGPDRSRLSGAVLLLEHVPAERLVLRGKVLVCAVQAAQVGAHEVVVALHGPDALPPHQFAAFVGVGTVADDVACTEDRVDLADLCQDGTQGLFIAMDV